MTDPARVGERDRREHEIPWGSPCEGPLWRAAIQPSRRQCKSRRDHRRHCCPTDPHALVSWRDARTAFPRSRPLPRRQNCRPVSIKLQARFDLAICRQCPNRKRCPVRADSHDGQIARFQYTPPRAENQKRRLLESSDAFRATYRWRAGIEATMSRLKHQINLAHLRIRGMPAMRYTVNLRALGLNIRRCAAVQACSQATCRELRSWSKVKHRFRSVWESAQSTLGNLLFTAPSKFRHSLP
ncbi:transposase [Microvirga sp. VF16]|uniref:transposase n=1 Tax=Microvirga sp. VF16 TaxID=2807101 RepID=UPI00193E443D|nr:transposase [Microvirga sp. VF16]